MKNHVVNRLPINQWYKLVQNFLFTGLFATILLMSK